MKFETAIDKTENLRMHKLSGPLAAKDVLEALRGVYSSPEFEPDTNVLWDVRDASVLSMSSSDVQEVSELVAKHWGTGGTSRAALVVSKDFEFGLMKMYQVYLESRISTEVRVFRDIDEALEWVKY
jgi:hypothetical protein